MKMSRMLLLCQNSRISVQERESGSGGRRLFDCFRKRSGGEREFIALAVDHQL